MWNNDDRSSICFKVTNSSLLMTLGYSSQAEPFLLLQARYEMERLFYNKGIYLPMLNLVFG